MKKILVAATAAIALSLSAFGAGYTVKTLDGQTFTDVTVWKINKDSVRLTHSEGIINVPFANLSKEDKEMLGVQIRLDIEKRREDEQKAAKQAAEAFKVATHHLSTQIAASDYPPELRLFVERYNLNVASRNRESLDAAVDVHELAALLESSAIPKSEFERIQREYEGTAQKLTQGEREILQTKANGELHRLQVDLKILDDYKALIASADNEALVRKGVENNETVVGMPQFALRVIKGRPSATDGSLWKYVNAKGKFDLYYFKDGKLEKEEHH